MGILIEFGYNEEVVLVTTLVSPVVAGALPGVRGAAKEARGAKIRVKKRKNIWMFMMNPS
jgi:hypothetical protein